MFKYTIELRKPNSSEWEPLKSWARPFTDGTTLDDTLDEGCINLSCTTRCEAIPPFSKIRITISESDENGNYKQVGQIIRVVGNTKRTRRTYSSSSPTLWDWNIQTLEETKLLERYICDSMMSTNYLSKDYTGGFNPVVGVVTATGGDQPTARYGVIFTPYQQGTSVEFPTVGGVAQLPASKLTEYQFGWGDGNLKIIDPNNQEVYSGNWVEKHSVLLSEIGTYKIKYVGESTVSYPPLWYPFGSPVTIEFDIGVFESIKPRANPTITSVCERLLSAGVTRRQGIEKQKFELDEAFANKYRDVPAPEFSFTRQTLFEALLTVGGYIHAIPRLDTKVDEKTGEEKQIVTFDELGGNDEIDMTNFPKQVYCDKVQNINDFCSTLDSPAQNLLNTQDRVAGAITELGNDYITVRAENAEVIIDADTAIIRTSLPINQIVKLECGYIDGRREPVGDITPYVYESAEYDVLSSYSGTAYPYSKAFALRYAQGDNKITGLQAVLNFNTIIGTLFNKESIINIIESKTGMSIAIKDIPKIIPRLAFRVTYVPIVTSRVLQRKPYGATYSRGINGSNNGAGWDNSIVYNQGGNMVESSFYGEKMKGAIARLGNEVEQRTYDFYHYEQLPKCGQKLDGMYIARVDAEYDITRIRATLTLTKDFNMLSQYVGLNSNMRMYDISEKQSVERFINYSENCYVGDRAASSKPPMMQNLFSCLKGTLENTSDSSSKVQVAIIRGKDKDGNDINNPVILPVMSFGFGNSLVFSCSMYDNYGAGFQNSDEFEVDKKYKGVQRLVPYADALGEMETMSIKMFYKGWDILDSSDQAPGGNANLYPQYTGDPSESRAAAIETGDYPLIVQKDSREALNFVYQVHFIANRPSVILGPSLTYSNAYVVSKQSKFAVYFFDNELNMLDRFVDLSKAHKYEGEGVGYEILIGSNFDDILDEIRIEVHNNTSNTYNAWAIVELTEGNKTRGSIFVGENTIVRPDDWEGVTFTIRSND